MPQIHLQMIQAAAKCDLVRNVVSVKGAPKMSRLLPMPELEKEFSKDPWEFDADRMKTFVLLTKRHSLNEEIPYDLNDPIPAEIQQKLEQINKVNSSVEIITVRLEVE